MSRVDQLPPPSPPVANLAPEPAAGNHALVNAGMALLPDALRAVSSGIGTATDPRNVSSQRGSLFAPQSWLALDLVRELRTFGMMYLDHRFRPSWTARLVPLSCLILLLLNFLLPGAGGFFHIFDIIPTVVAYKALSREAVRYRAEMAYYLTGR
jgi:hypothetical protein